MVYDQKKTSEIPLICISEEMFKNLPQLQKGLVELYLGVEKEYQLEFDLYHLPILNRVFDEIIFKFGFRKVVFRFPSCCDYESFRKALNRKKPR